MFRTSTRWATPGVVVSRTVLTCPTTRLPSRYTSPVSAAGDRLTSKHAAAGSHAAAPCADAAFSAHGSANSNNPNAKARTPLATLNDMLASMHAGALHATPLPIPFQPLTISASITKRRGPVKGRFVPIGGAEYEKRPDWFLKTCQVCEGLNGALTSRWAIAL